MKVSCINNYNHMQTVSLKGRKGNSPVSSSLPYDKFTGSQVENKANVSVLAEANKILDDGKFILDTNIPEKIINDNLAKNGQKLSTEGYLVRHAADISVYKAMQKITRNPLAIQEKDGRTFVEEYDAKGELSERTYFERKNGLIHLTGIEVYVSEGNLGLVEFDENTNDIKTIKIKAREDGNKASKIYKYDGIALTEAGEDYDNSENELRYSTLYKYENYSLKEIYQDYKMDKNALDSLNKYETYEAKPVITARRKVVFSDDSKKTYYGWYKLNSYNTESADVVRLFDEQRLTKYIEGFKKFRKDITQSTKEYDFENHSLKAYYEDTNINDFDGKASSKKIFLFNPYSRNNALNHVIFDYHEP